MSDAKNALTLEEILLADKKAREIAKEFLKI
jgi:hypothetical protein